MVVLIELLSGQLRGDYRKDGEAGNRLRPWTKSDIVPRPDDISERGYIAFHWITSESLSKGRQETFFATPTEDDRARELRVVGIVENIWRTGRRNGFVPDMEIQSGIETARLLRERGWTHWHHLFAPRQLLIGAMVAEEIEKISDDELRACLSFDRTFVAHKSARLSSGG